MKSYTPEELGISSPAVIRMLNGLKELDSLNSIMLLRHGKCCLEAYWKPYRADVPHALFSLSKCFTSCAVGFAVAEGLLSLQAPVVSFFPEEQDAIVDPQMRDMTVADLLTMRAGHSECPNAQVIPAQNWVRAFLGTRLAYKPGTVFAYNSIASYMLASIIRRLTGMNVREYLMPRLFQPLGIEPGFWECCPMGTNKGGWGLFLKTGDLAKFGQLLLQKGVWNGQQILPAAYLEKAVTAIADTVRSSTEPDWRQGYGYHFWRSTHGFRGDGASSQYILVLPEEDMCILVTAGCGTMQKVLDPIWEKLLPCLSDAPLPPNPDALQRISEIKDALELPLACGRLTGAHAPASFAFKDNAGGIEALDIAFGADACRLNFRLAGGRSECIEAGFGYRKPNIVSLCEALPLQVHASAAWCDDGKLTVELTGMACYRDTITIDWASKDEPFSIIRRYGAFRQAFPRLFLKA